MIYPLITTGQL